MRKCAILLVLLSILCFPVNALSDGAYCVSVEMTGGSGKASITNPTRMNVEQGNAYAEIVWSSSNYDYMIVDGVRYDNESEPGMNSVFHIPVTIWDAPMSVIADTTAMGKPVEIQYQLYFYQESIGDISQLPQEAAKRVLIMAGFIIIVGGVLNHRIKKKNQG